jgi:hypothetical protein
MSVLRVEEIILNLRVLNSIEISVHQFCINSPVNCKNKTVNTTTNNNNNNIVKE